MAGGSGTRMGTAVPKQFLELAGKPVMAHTVAAFLEAIPDVHLVLVLPPAQLSYAQVILQAFPDRIDAELVVGGETRFHSVKNGLAVVPANALVAVHDGVRALVSPALIRRCFSEAAVHGSAVPVTPVLDSIRQVSGEQSQSLDRGILRAVQTPQTFKADILKAVFEQPYTDAFTDEATVFEAVGGRVHLVQGERGNLKITTPEDLLIAEALLRHRE